MSCFHNNHFRLKEGKEELNSFWFLLLDLALYYPFKAYWLRDAPTV